MDIYNYPSGLDSKIINGYTYEISFEKDNESISIYANEQGKVYLHIHAEVEDVMGLHVNYKLIRDTLCQENPKALLCIFSNDYEM